MLPECSQHTVTRHIAYQLYPVARNTLNGLFACAASEDSGATSSMLFHAGLHFDYQRGRKLSRSTIHYYGETIRATRNSLAAREEMPSDSTICMVAFLAASGVSTFPNSNQVSVKMSNFLNSEYNR